MNTGSVCGITGLLHRVFFLMFRRPPSSTQRKSSAASDVYKSRVYMEGMEREMSYFLTIFGPHRAYKVYRHLRTYTLVCFSMSVGSITKILPHHHASAPTSCIAINFSLLQHLTHWFNIYLFWRVLPSMHKTNCRTLFWLLK